MIINQIRELITSCMDDVVLKYHGDTIFVNPWNESKFELAYKNIKKTYTNIDELISDKIYEGKSLEDIAKDVTEA